ncbi:Thioredoxin-related protein [Salegentibacter holothuriorum]|jgi:thioredoxin-related protein|uniref:Thioredoxin-related protein n=1 Tax=Salegentibacter holothuriorum TaxID=241145 RepID=A0A1T5A646_9FLAO|nr:thioredoxin family protein [Salegentibacter holothuriorum]SKB30408.1 Thioredoxin-related protein [Salegentibacter holothuriorum]|tara:strand:- start:686 stop:1126 length:441 start_codon:yes stop_codon:yes gene_type:complete
MKKKILILVVVLLNLSTIYAQEWQTDFEKAKKTASTEDKPIVLVFQGSDWCAPCIKLDRQVWSTAAFKKYASEHYVMLQADFPRKRENSLSETQAKANAKLAETYNSNGIFPFVVVLDANGNVLGKTGYKKTTPEQYIKELNAFTE